MSHTSPGHDHHAAHDHAGHQHGDDHHGGHDPSGQSGHDHHADMGSRSMALSATLHCLTGCAIGEILGLMIGTAIGLSTGWTIALAVSLAFLFGYALSTLPLLKVGLGFFAALSVVLAADTLSIATMEVVDNAVMALIPGAMDAGLVNPIFWASMMFALTVAGFAAYPVNKYLLARGKGHALTHEYHGASSEVTGARRYIPSFATSTLVGIIVAFMLGGLVVSFADELGNDDEGSTGGGGHAQPSWVVRFSEKSSMSDTGRAAQGPNLSSNGGDAGFEPLAEPFPGVSDTFVSRADYFRVQPMDGMAVAVGFEPTVGLHPHTLSRRAP